MIRIALVGCGDISTRHAARFEALASRMKVTATVDIDEGLARQAASDIGAERFSTDYRDVLPHVDAVLLALPHDLHHPIGVDCLKAGKHVLLEKPLANTEQECLDLIAAAKESGKVLMVAYCIRFNAAVQEIKRLIENKTYGETFQVSIWTEQFTMYPPDHWAASAAKLGGGQFFSHGCHYVDLLLWFLGEPTRGTHVGTRLGTPWMEKEGTSNVCIEFENGALGYHMGTWGARGTVLRNSMHVHCTEGMLELSSNRGRLTLHRDTVDGLEATEEILLECETGKPMQQEMAHFLDCIESGAQPLTNAEDSLQGLRLIWRLYDAEKNDKVADLRGLGIN